MKRDKFFVLDETDASENTSAELKYGQRLFVVDHANHLGERTTTLEPATSRKPYAGKNERLHDEFLSMILAREGEDC